MKLTKIKKKLTSSTKSLLTKLKKKRAVVRRKRTVAKKKACKKLIGAVKKKAAPKKVTSTHKDTKSHNVNIKVMSGVSNLKRDILGDYDKILRKQKELEYGIAVHQRYLKTPGRPKGLKDNDRKLLKLYKLILRENKEHAAQLKKLL